MASRKQRTAVYPSELHAIMEFFLQNIDSLRPGKAVFNAYLRIDGVVDRDPKVLWQWATRELPRMPAAPPGQYTQEQLDAILAKLQLNMQALIEERQMLLARLKEFREMRKKEEENVLVTICEMVGAEVEVTPMFQVADKWGVSRQSLAKFLRFEEGPIVRKQLISKWREMDK